MDITEKLHFIGLAISFLITLVGFIISFVKAVKAGKLRELGKEIKNYVIEAEGMTDFTGEQKKQFVISKAKEFSAKINFTFDENLVCKIIEGIIDLSKKVNVKDGDANKHIVSNENVQ